MNEMEIKLRGLISAFKGDKKGLDTGKWLAYLLFAKGILTKEDIHIWEKVISETYTDNYLE